MRSYALAATRKAKHSYLHELTPFYLESRAAQPEPRLGILSGAGA